MRRRRAQPKAEARRGEIFRAALECFAELGFSRTTMADIRRRARASTGSIYHQFESKEQLAAEIYLAGLADYQAGWIAALEREEDARRGLRAVIAHHVRWVRENEIWARYLFQRRHSSFAPAAERRIASAKAALRQRAAPWFAAQVEAGRLRSLPPDITAALLAGPYLENTRHYLSGQECTEAGAGIELLADAAWRALAVHADPPARSRRRGGRAPRGTEQRRTGGGARG